MPTINNPSLYPNAFDGYANLPILDNFVSELNEDLPNTQTDAILKMQHALGLLPQGSKPTLTDRLSVAINPDGTLKSIPVELLTAQPAQDRNILLDGGGIITWDVPNARLTWTSNLVVQFPVSGNSPTLVAPQTVLLPAPGHVLAVNISRTGVPQLRSAIAATLADPLLNSNDSIVLAARDYSNRIFWRNGTIYEDQDSLSFEQISARRIFFDKIPTTLVSTNVQSAIDELDGKINNNDNTSTTSIATKESESLSRDSNLQDQIDDIYNDEDRSLLAIGGGNFAFNSTTNQLSFTQDIRIYQTTIGGDGIVKQNLLSPIVLPTVRSIVYATIDRAAGIDYDITSLTVVGTSALPAVSNALALATRISTNAVRLFNGTVVFDESVATPHAEGEGVASHIKYNNVAAAMPGSPSTVQAALDSLDTRLDALDSTVTAAHFIPINGIIFIIGSTCPAGYLAVPELVDMFVRGGATGSLSVVGSNTHVHTGSTGSAGDHTHALTGMKVTLPIMNISSVATGGGLAFDAFPTTFEPANAVSPPASVPIDVAVSGSLATGGAHTHAFTTASTSHVPQHVILKACKAV